MLRGITNIPEFEIRNEIERSISPEKIEKERIGKYWPFDHSTRFWNKRQKEEYPRLNVILNSFRLTMHIFLTEIVLSLYVLWIASNHNCLHSQIVFKLVTFSWSFKARLVINLIFKAYWLRLIININIYEESRYRLKLNCSGRKFRLLAKYFTDTRHKVKLYIWN